MAYPERERARCLPPASNMIPGQSSLRHGSAFFESHEWGQTALEVFGLPEAERSLRG
jgi:hypothetical protein